RPAGQHFDEHGNHHFRPAFTNERQRAVEIEQDMTDPGARCEARTEFNQAMKGARRNHRPVSRIGFSQKSIMATVRRGAYSTPVCLAAERTTKHQTPSSKEVPNLKHQNSVSERTIGAQTSIRSKVGG